MFFRKVADRIVFWVKGSEKGVKCLCYCLTKSRCHTISKYLNSRGISADTITGDDNLHRKECVLNAFSSGKIQVLCCTSVLGRGFHLDDIRFVFHAAVPVDLTEYIQQAGRAGRDGKKARCILFFRAQDFAVVRRIKLQSQDCENLKASVERDISKVHVYAMSSECRYSHLAATATIDQCRPADQKCTKEAPCDNCEMESTAKKFFEVKHIFNSMLGHSRCDFDNKKNSLSDDLLQLFFNTGVLRGNGRQIFPASHFDAVHESLRSNSLRFFVKVEKHGLPLQPSLIESVQEKKVIDVDLFQSEHVQNTCKTTSSDSFDLLNISFVVRFEAER
jgi:superfamily II DNA helicase RecQ